MKITETVLQYWASRKTPPLCGKVIKQVSVHTIVNINGGQGFDYTGNKASSTVNLIRSKMRRGFTATEAMRDIYGNCPADPRRNARLSKWITRIQNSNKL